MYKVLSKKLIFIGFAWLVLGLLAVVALLEAWHISVRVALIPALAWIVLNLILWTPVWRYFWRKIPILQTLIFPDLNGNWDVELRSNWPRQEQLLKAALSTSESIDILKCEEEDLVPLGSLMLKAKITQTWWKIDMLMWNPAEDSPLERSDSISVEPFRQEGHRSPGICYFYKQVNRSDKNVTDDTEFFGAARLLYDFEREVLTGLAWTARMWPRAINTAAQLTFTRENAG